ncbi:phenylacetate--CoA ligase family protein [Zobellia barbeyronii]|uniref:Phenylacetate--CoA ligase family protein n=1 Tax=Zobellia barbeyronii TaxID=2748009 RepID=A0ABS5W8I7_9FLAO|nr:AMP-binding protein [Zobellia barbeyronii]MBT2159754.1 phenylacetate--CoA ligase family protein [Zobellia barbeyronii]
MKKFLFDLKTKTLKPKIHRSHLRAEDELKSGQIQILNFEKRKRIINHAFENTAFYKSKYQGLENQLHMSNEEDFQNLPPVTRDDLAQNFEKFIAGNPSKNTYRKVSSSGSTGRPISVLHDTRFPYTVLQWRILGWWNIKPYENQAFIYRYKRPFIKRLGNTFLWWPTQRIFLTGSEMNLRNVKHFVNQFNSLKPTLLQGYVDVVYEFALFLLDNNLKIHPPKMVWVTSAPLFENQRKTMEAAFGAPVCDQYGNTEVFTIAAECPQQHGLHIMHDAVHVEIVDEKNNPVPAGTTGKILITDLHNEVFPLIRYEIGDRGKLLDTVCSCGIPLPLMDNVRGRQSVVLKTPSGLTVRSEHLTILFEKLLHTIREVQLIQNKDYSVELRYVFNSIENVEDEVETILKELRIKTRNEIAITPNRVDELQTKSNKKPLIISELP